MIVEILFMMKKKGCDYMFKKLVMLLCFGILLSFGAVSAQASDELPPLVIETDDVKYAGIMLKLDKNPTIVRTIVKKYVPNMKDIQISRM